VEVSRDRAGVDGADHFNGDGDGVGLRARREGQVFIDSVAPLNGVGLAVVGEGGGDEGAWKHRFAEFTDDVAAGGEVGEGGDAEDDAMFKHGGRVDFGEDELLTWPELGCGENGVVGDWVEEFGGGGAALN
jgi:hypothetical protein